MHSFIKNSIKRLTKYISQNGLLMKVCCLLVTAFLLAGFSSYKADAASGIQIYNYTTKKTTTYADKQVQVIYNGNAIGDIQTPGILVDGIALLPYYDIFKASGIAAECLYNKEKGSISISKYGIEIVMTIGSKNATVNGNAVTLPVAPMKMKYVEAGKTKVLVPSRFVSETLGLGYAWNSNQCTITIEKYTISLAYNNNAKFEYSGVLGKVSVNGKNVDLGPMPSIITNNTAMLRAKKVFSDSAIDADYFYNKTDKTITLIKGENVLIMTVGSKKAHLNNKAVTMDTAPMIVTNYETDNSYIMVPGGFTATSLGYDYKWNNSTRTSMITSQTKPSDTAGNTPVSDPELGDSGLINEPGTVLNQWSGLSSEYSSYVGIHELNGASSGLGNIFYASRDYNNVSLNSETFMIVASSAFGKVTANNSGKVITLTAENMTCTDITYQMSGSTSNLINTLGTYNAANNCTTVELEVLSPEYLYNITFSPDNTILYVTVYMNSITSSVVGKNSVGDYLTLTGLIPIKANITVQTGLMIVDLPYTTNSVGSIVSDIIGADYIKQIFISYAANRTQMIISLNEGYQYYTLESGNQFTISFQSPGNQSDQTGTSDDDDSSGGTDESDISDGSDLPEAPVTAEIPEVEDTSRYEIIIPIPAEIDRSQISHEDYYFEKYFVIRITGDYTEFYENNNITQNSSVINKISVSLNSKNQTVLKVATTKLQGYELAVDNSNLYINIGDPREIYKNIVVLDPGHGGSANGAQYYGSMEKEVNFSILYTIGKKYFNSNPSELKVYYTRTSDTNPLLSERAAMVKTFGADLFVSLHMNAAEATVVGTEVFYSGRNNIKNSAGLSGATLASIFVTSLTDKLGTDNRGVKKEDYTVIYKNTVPAVLVELGFLSTKSEHARLTDQVFQENAAKTIYDTLLEVFEAYPTGR